jgi:CopG family nickel-responsive transcriptional regulator
MQRVTITVDDDLMAEIDAVMASRGYRNRSEAIRDLTRAGMDLVRTEAGEGGICVAALVYLFDHEKRDLARRLADTQHRHHGLSLATTHIHLDDDRCLEVALLRGAAGEVRHLADHVMSERGVRHGRLVLIPVDAEESEAGGA